MSEYRVSLDLEGLAEALFRSCWVPDLKAFERELRVSWRRLSERQASVLERRWGLYQGFDLSWSEAGKVLGLTRRQVQLAERAALRRLRHPSTGLRDLVELIEDA